MPAPNIYITISDAVDIISNEEERKVARSTVYGWLKEGRGGAVLQTIRRAGKLYTRKQWVGEFLDAIR